MKKETAMNTRVTAEASQQRNRAILRYIHEFYIARRYPPVFSDICDRFAISRTVAFAAVSRLRGDGLLTHQPQLIARALRVTSAGLTCLGVAEFDITSKAAMQLMPVLHSTEALRQWLASPMYRERLPAAQALAGQTVEIWDRS